MALFADYVGMDEYRNRYYELKAKDYLGRRRRVCIYNGIVEASKIPSQWHSWMHYNAESSVSYKQLFWVKSHTPNLTGTVYAFLPNKHTQFNVYGKFHINKQKSYTPWVGISAQE